MSTRSLGVLTLDLVAKVGGFIAGMTSAERAASKSLSQIEKNAQTFGRGLGIGLKAAAAAAGTAFTAIVLVTRAAINQADAIRDASIQLGISTETLSAYSYAASQTGTNMESLSKGLKTLAKNAAEALDPKSAKAGLFKALGVDVKDAHGNLKQLDVLLPEVADKFRLLEDGTTKAALAQELLGKSGLELTEFLNQGSAGLDAFAQKAAELGIIIDQQTAAAADEFNDKLGDLGATTQGLGVLIASGLLPQLSKSTDEFRELVNQGQLADNIIVLFNAALQTGTVLLRGYNRAVQEMSLSIGFAVEAGKGLLELQTNVASFGAANGSVVGGLKRISHGYGEASAASKELQAEWKKEDDLRRVREQTAGQYTDSNTRRRGGGMSVAQLSQNAKDRKEAEATAKRVAGFFSAGSGGGAKAGKSDAVKEAEALQKAYDSLKESQLEQIALFGKVGEAAKVAYEIQSGNLAKLDPAKQQELLQLAQQIDSMKEMAELEKAAKEAADKESERIRDAIKDNNELLEAMQFELDLMGMTNNERERELALRQLNLDATDEQKQKVAELADAYTDMQETISVMDDIRGGFKDFFSDVLTGTKSVKDAFKDMLDDIQKRILDRIAQNWVDQLFGEAGSSGGGASAGGGTNWLQMIAGLFTGGRAAGGQVKPWSMYQVNESGMEGLTVGGRDYLMTGSNAGVVTSANRVGGGGGKQEFNFYNAQLESRNSAQQFAQEAGIKQRIAMGRLG